MTTRRSTLPTEVPNARPVKSSKRKRKGSDVAPEPSEPVACLIDSAQCPTPESKL